MMDANAVTQSMRQYLIPQESLCPSPLLEITNYKRKLLKVHYFSSNRWPQQLLAGKCLGTFREQDSNYQAADRKRNKSGNHRLPTMSQKNQSNGPHENHQIADIARKRSHIAGARTITGKNQTRHPASEEAGSTADSVCEC